MPTPRKKPIYYDGSFAVPCKLNFLMFESIDQLKEFQRRRREDGVIMRDIIADVTLTANRPGYKRGETFACSFCDIIYTIGRLGYCTTMDLMDAINRCPDLFMKGQPIAHSTVRDQLESR